MLTQVNPLQIVPIPNKGYYAEKINSSLVLENYHTTYISFNLSNIHLTLNQLLRNNLVLKNQLITKYPENKYLQFQLNHAYNQLENAFNNLYKLKHDKLNLRKRRGLINILGSSIKFITGNLDQKDLENINNHFENIKANEIKTIRKLNELSSFAGHISEKLQSDITSVYNNTQKLDQGLTNAYNLLDLTLLLQDHYLQISIVNSHLIRLLNTITFASINILDIDLINLNQIRDIWNFLKAHYSNYQLWPLDQFYEVILICKVGFAQINNDKAIMVVKIPLFKESLCHLQIIYPTPTDKQLILVPPSKYYCDDAWYNECQSINNKWFCSNQLIDSCQIKECNYALVNNNYRISVHTQNNKFLYCSNKPIEITEVCKSVSKKIISNCNLISSYCDLIIGNERFSNISFKITETLENVTIERKTKKNINLKLYHLKEPLKLKDDLFEPIEYTEFVTKTNHYSIISVILLLIVILCVVSLVIYKKRIRSSISKKILQKILNEDVENSKGRGVITSSQP